MGAAAESEKEIVETEILNVVVGDEAVAHCGEVDGAVVLVDLDGVAAAEGDVGTTFAGKMGEDTLAADVAVRIGLAGVDFAMFVIPQIKRQ